MGNLLSYYAAYSPAFTTQRTEGAVIMLNAFSEKITLDKSKVLKEMRFAFKHMERRRKCFDVKKAEGWLRGFEKEV